VPEVDVEPALERARRAAQALEARLEHETLADIFDLLDEWYVAGLLADARSGLSSNVDRSSGS
jgi:hypothetical protein